MSDQDQYCRHQCGDLKCAEAGECLKFREAAETTAKLHSIPELVELALDGVRRATPHDGIVELRRRLFADKSGLTDEGEITLPPDHKEGDTVHIAPGDEPFVKNQFGAMKQAKLQRYDLLPWEALDAVTEVLGLGAIKYEEHNWRKGFDYGALVSSACHHISSTVQGEDYDPETGKLHTAHAICQLLFLLSHQLTGAGNDNRYVVAPEVEAQAANDDDQWHVVPGVGEVPAY